MSCRRNWRINYSNWRTILMHMKRKKRTKFFTWTIKLMSSSYNSALWTNRGQSYRTKLRQPLQMQEIRAQNWDRSWCRLIICIRDAEMRDRFWSTRLMMNIWVLLILMIFKSKVGSLTLQFYSLGIEAIHQL